MMYYLNESFCICMWKLLMNIVKGNGVNVKCKMFVLFVFEIYMNIFYGFKKIV